MLPTCGFSYLYYRLEFRNWKAGQDAERVSVAKRPAILTGGNATPVAGDCSQQRRSVANSNLNFQTSGNPAHHLVFSRLSFGPALKGTSIRGQLSTEGILGPAPVNLKCLMPSGQLQPPSDKIYP